MVGSIQSDCSAKRLYGCMYMYLFFVLKYSKIIFGR